MSVQRVDVRSRGSSGEGAVYRANSACFIKCIVKAQDHV